MDQLRLFDQPPDLPEGFRYRPDLLSPEDEHGLVAWFAGLAFKDFEFRGFLGKRRVISFGWRYDFNVRTLDRTEDMPPELLPLRETAACFAGLVPSSLQHALITEYMPGAAIGWHRDRPEFGDVIGVSFAAPCVLRLRQRLEAGWKRASLRLEPRSAYLLRGPARTEWEHSIRPVDRLRYSVTFRSLRADEGAMLSGVSGSSTAEE